MMRALWRLGLPGWLLWFTSCTAHAETTLQLCPRQHAPAGGVQADILRPTGEPLRAVLTTTPAAPGCAALPLGPAAAQVLAIRPVPAHVAHRLAGGLTLSGRPLDNGFAISEVSPRAAPEATTPVPQPLPMFTNLLPLLSARVFGAEARAKVTLNDQGLLLQCEPGKQPAGLVLGANKPALPAGRTLLQLRASGTGRFQLNSADARDAARQSGTVLGPLPTTGMQAVQTHVYPLPRDAWHLAQWQHWTLACPVAAARLQLQGVQLLPVTAPVPPRATWVWQSGDWRDTPDAVLVMAQRHRIQTLFISVPLAHGVVEAPTRLADFVRRARAAGLAVWAVDGDPHMVRPNEHASAAARANAYTRYNRQATPAARLAGVQFDVEPYLLPGYDLATEAWEHQYTTLVAALHAGADGLPLEMVVPFWWGGKTALLDRLAAHVSSLTVMDYRTSAAEIVRFAQPFLDWGNRQRKAVRIALEAGPVAAETLRRFQVAASGEVWQLTLSGQDFLLLLAEPAPNPHGPAFRQVGSTTLSGNATSFHTQPQRLLEMLPALEAQLAAWPEFAGIALHEIR